MLINFCTLYGNGSEDHDLHLNWKCILVQYSVKMTFSEKERRGDLIQTLLRRNFKYSCSQIVSFIITLVFAYFVVAFVWNLWLILFQGVKPAESELHQQQLSSLDEQGRCISNILHIQYPLPNPWLMS